MSTDSYSRPCFFSARYVASHCTQAGLLKTVMVMIDVLSNPSWGAPCPEYPPCNYNLVIRPSGYRCPGPPDGIDTTPCGGRKTGPQHFVCVSCCGRVIHSLDRRACGVLGARSEEHTSELQSRFDLVCRLLLEKKKNIL